jgi:hypothetical protein
MHTLPHPAALPAPAPGFLAPVHEVEARRVERPEKAPVRPVQPGSYVASIHELLMARMGVGVRA